MKIAVAVLLCAMLFTLYPLAAMAGQDDYAALGAQGYVGDVLYGSDDSDMEQKKVKSEDSDPVPLTDEDVQNAEALIGKVQEMDALTGEQQFNGMNYWELFDENGQEAMKSIASRELFQKVLTTQIPWGTNVLADVWGMAAEAALLSGGYNKFYYVDDYWTPNTFSQAFDIWSSTWCWYKCNGAESVYEQFSKPANLQYARSFSDVANAMKQSVKDTSDYVYKGLKGNNDAYNDILKNWSSPDSEAKYSGDIFYNIYTKVIHRGASGDESSGHLGYAWDSFALCFYDFQIVPLYDALKPGDDDSENVFYELLSEDDKTAAFATNDSAEDITVDKTRSEGKTTTTSNTISTSSTLSFTEGGSFSYTHNFGKYPFEDSTTISVDFHSTQSSTTSESQTTGESVTHTDTFSVKGTAKPATQISITQSAATSRGAISYTCPVTFKYKVAVLSLCGDYSGALPYRTVNVNYSGFTRIFGADTGDALEDVKDRYANTSYDDYHLVWNTKPITTTLNDNRFYSSVGGTMTFIVHHNLSSISPLTPLHPLKKTAVDPQKSTYIIHMSKDHPNENKLNMGTVDVEGIAVLGDGMDVPYYGFSRAKGAWKLCDANGNLIDSSDLAEIQTTGAGTFLVAKKAGTEPVNLKYIIADNTYPAFPGIVEKKDVYLKNDDLAASAMIEVYIYDEGNFAGSLTLSNRAEDEIVVHLNRSTGMAQIDLNADTALEYEAYDVNGSSIAGIPSVTWSAASAYDTCEVTPEGLFTATAAGDYEVQIAYHGVVSNSVIIHVAEALPEHAEGEGTWQQDEYGRWYMNPDGSYPAASWLEIDGNWYHFDDEGYMQTGWTWAENDWYYLDPDGTLVTGWIPYGDCWYYVNEDRNYAYGWLKDGDDWYYLGYDGIMTTGWQFIDGAWYCFDGTGKMYADTYIDQIYYVDANGRWNGQE